VIIEHCIFNPYEDPDKEEEYLYNMDHAPDFLPDFSRYGCLPQWFPTTDRLDRELTNQGQCDRFLYLLDKAYGGFLGDHHDVNPRFVAEALVELASNIGVYESMEEEDGMEYEMNTKGSSPK